MTSNFKQNIKKNPISQFRVINIKVDFWAKNHQKWPKSAKREFSQKSGFHF